MNNETIPSGDVSAAVDESALASSVFGDEPAQDRAAEPVQDQPQDTPADDGEQVDESSADYLDDFASKYELDPEQLLGLKVKLKIDGEEKDATLRDLIKVNQLEGHVNRKSIELSERQKKWEGEQVQLREAWNQRIQIAGQTLDAQEQALQQQYQGVNWDALYQTDPGQYAVLQTRFQQAYQQIMGQKQNLTNHYQQTLHQWKESIRPKAADAIRQQHPDLTDSASYGNAIAEMKSYLKEIGADERNFEALEMDPVVFTVARDAARYRALMAKKPEVSSKLKAAPNFEKPSPKDSFGAKQARNKQLQARANAGDEEAIAELFFKS